MRHQQLERRLRHIRVAGPSQDANDQRSQRGGSRIFARLGIPAQSLELGEINGAQETLERRVERLGSKEGRYRGEIVGQLLPYSVFCAKELTFL